MRGSILRLISVVVLLAVATISAGPVLCLLPCASIESAVADSGEHCQQSAGQATSRLTGVASSCDDCDDLRLDAADRIESRNTVGITITTSAAAIELPWHHSVRSNPHGATGPPPGPHIPIDAHQPLRI